MCDMPGGYSIWIQLLNLWKKQKGIRTDTGRIRHTVRSWFAFCAWAGTGKGNCSNGQGKCCFGDVWDGSCTCKKGWRIMDTFRTAYVYVRRVYAGILCETDSGYSFQYDEDYLKTENATAVSLTLPVRTETYYAKVLFPFFDGLIPEGWLLNVVSRNWKIALDYYLYPVKMRLVMSA